MKNNNKLTKVLSGVAGEYYVAAELSKRGYVASITLRNTRGIDILCTNEETYKAVNIQVKTNQGPERSWILGEKAENEKDNNLFYVFVCLNGGDKHPNFFVVPSNDVARYTKETNDEFLNTLGKKGQQRKPNSIRNFKDYEEKYINRWDLLNI